VTGTDNLDVSAWAFDSGVALAPRMIGSPVFTAGYSFGSGDDDATDGTDNEFRQTDLQGSSSRIGLERQQQKNYGEVLRPELSNIHILTAGVGVPVTEGTDIGLTYFNYHLAEDATSLRSSGISAPMNGTDKDIGQAADVIINVDIDKELDMSSRYVDDIGFRLVLGSFFAGDAYEPNTEDDAYRIFTELRFRF
jgi:alginate production protein